MNARKLLFLDRDGTLIVEPPDKQIDAFDKFAMIDGVIAALQKCVAAGYELVMVTNQDGLGTPAFPQAAFEGPQNLLLQILGSQGMRFREVLIDASLPADDRDTRKPGTGLVRHYLADDSWSRAQSAMVGDRETDARFAANLGIRVFRLDTGEWDWPGIAHALCDAPRRARVERATNETRVVASVDLDLVADPIVHAGIGFFDHMLEQLGKHGGFSLELRCTGDTHVDEHHSVEDSALALGEALRAALGDKRGMGRYGFALPMDEAQASAVLDLSGRACFFFDGAFPRDRIGELPTELVPHFFRSLCDALGANLHLSVRGENAHHMVEACFKAVGRALRMALRRDGVELPSTKGAL
jgi:imidazoleglycerol-phosphate dehydratase/histidinol-phosphatase